MIKLIIDNDVKLTYKQISYAARIFKPINFIAHIVFVPSNTIIPNQNFD